VANEPAFRVVLVSKQKLLYNVFVSNVVPVWIFNIF